MDEARVWIIIKTFKQCFCSLAALLREDIFFMLYHAAQNSKSWLKYASNLYNCFFFNSMSDKVKHCLNYNTENNRQSLLCFV